MLACARVHLRCCSMMSKKFDEPMVKRNVFSNHMCGCHGTIHRHIDVIIETLKVKVNHRYRNPGTQMVNGRCQDQLIVHQGVSSDAPAGHCDLGAS